MAIFGWCNTNNHAACMVTNAGTTCTCDCDNHGSNYQGYTLTPEESRIRGIADKALANNVFSKENKVDLRKKDSKKSPITYDEALAKIQDKKKNKKPDATTIEELQMKR